ncbi:MAG: OmpA family protein, partial [Bacteroidota bacterium]
DEKRIIIESNLRSGNRGEGDAFYNSVSFDEYEVDKKISTIKSSNNTGNASSPAAVEIKEILFPYGESNILNSTEVNAFLSDLAKRAIQSKEKIILTGHTDNESGSDFNYRLGLKRANKVKSILLNKRVPSGQISVLSKGEESPRASNSTEAGRQRNRRVEVVIQ